MPNDHWKDYYQATASRPPSKLLVSALKHVKNKGKALDLGAGGLADSAFLLHEGFEVVAVDSSPSSAELAMKINDPRFSFVRSSYDQFEFEPDTYDLITAQWALPFNSPGTFSMMFEKLKDSLKVGGIFVGQFFGKNDEWNVPRKDMTFLMREEVQEFLSRMHVIRLKEVEEDSSTAMGEMKHWHVFHVIAKKD